MKISITNRSKMDVGFILWIVTEYVLIHTVYAQVALVFFCAMVMLHYTGNRSMPWSKIFFLYLFFWLICYLNIKLGYSINANESQKLVGTIGLNFLFIVAAYYYFVNSQFSQIISVLTTSAILISILSWILNFFQTGSMMFRETGGINSNGMSILNAFVVCLIWASGYSQIKKYRVHIFTLLFFCIISGTRKSIVLLVVFLLLYYCFKYPQKVPKYIIISIIGLSILYYALIHIPFLYNNIGIRIESLISFLQNGEGDSSVVSRASYISLGIRYFNNSRIWGNGINCFRTTTGAYGTYSHNNYVELLFSVGLLGTVSYYLIYICIIVKGAIEYHKNKRNGALIAIIIVITCAVTDYAQVVYYDRGSLLFLVLALGLIDKEITLSTSQSKENNNCVCLR